MKKSLLIHFMGEWMVKLITTTQDSTPHFLTSPAVCSSPSSPVQQLCSPADSPSLEGGLATHSPAPSPACHPPLQPASHANKFGSRQQNQGQQPITFYHLKCSRTFKVLGLGFGAHRLSVAQPSSFRPNLG